MLVIGSQPLDAVGDEFAQAADVFIFRGKHADVRRFFFPGASVPVPKRRRRQPCRVAKLLQNGLLDSKRIGDALANGLLVKIYVGNGDEQVGADKLVDVLGRSFTLLAQPRERRRQPFGGVNQHVQHGGNFGLFAAQPGVAAGDAVGCLLALEAEHFGVHGTVLFLVLNVTRGDWLVGRKKNDPPRREDGHP